MIKIQRKGYIGSFINGKIHGESKSTKETGKR